MKTSIWESKFIKICTAAAGILIGVALLAAVSIFLQYRKTAQKNPDSVLVSGPVLIPERTPALGEKLICRTVVRVPWNKKPADLQFQPGEGIQLTGLPVFSRLKYLWGWTLWQIDLPLQPYRSGQTGSSQGELKIAGPDKTDLIPLNLPVMTVRPPTPDKNNPKLALAGEIIPDKTVNRRLWLYAAAGILVILILYLILKRFTGKVQAAAKRQPAVWESALSAIAELTEAVKAVRISPEKGIASLTDIVRQYLEKRFRLRAEHQTTGEFLSELERNERLLSEQDRRFLKSFLASADMVKFAKLPADQTLYGSAAVRAEELVRGTTPADPDHQGGK